jgi:hypothetical protein
VKLQVRCLLQLQVSAVGQNSHFLSDSCGLTLRVGAKRNGRKLKNIPFIIIIIIIIIIYTYILGAYGGGERCAQDFGVEA